MPYGYGTQFANAMLNGIRGVTFASSGATVQLHCGDPGPDGLDNISTGDSTRQPITFAEASAGRLRPATYPVWTNSAGVEETITHVAVFNNAGLFLWSAPLNPRSWGDGSSFSLTALGLDLGPLAANG